MRIPALGLIVPSPPAFDTAAASSAFAIHVIPPWIMGYSMPSSLQILDVRTMSSLS
jgi:hypothetical protein